MGIHSPDATLRQSSLSSQSVRVPIQSLEGHPKSHSRSHRRYSRATLKSPESRHCRHSEDTTTVRHGRRNQHQLSNNRDNGKKKVNSRKKRKSRNIQYIRKNRTSRKEKKQFPEEKNKFPEENPVAASVSKFQRCEHPTIEEDTLLNLRAM